MKTYNVLNNFVKTFWCSGKNATVKLELCDDGSEDEVQDWFVEIKYHSNDPFDFSEEEEFHLFLSKEKIVVYYDPIIMDDDSLVTPVKHVTYAMYRWLVNHGINFEE